MGVYLGLKGLIKTGRICFAGDFSSGDRKENLRTWSPGNENEINHNGSNRDLLPAVPSRR